MAIDTARRKGTANFYVDHPKFVCLFTKGEESIDEERNDLRELGATVYDILYAIATAREDVEVVVLLEACTDPNIATSAEYREATGMTAAELWAARRRLDTLVSHLPKHLRDLSHAHLGETP
ncbi:MAG: hypothetical protein IPN77_22395 [Sandaracinaceae bacterium]|nr:hypothetical protein [Sandaracinaceae bacterium]